jgi:hypothetical protein
VSEIDDQQQQEDELWEEVPEPEEIKEEELADLPIDVDAEETVEESEAEEQPAADVMSDPMPKRKPDRFINLRGGPFGNTHPHDDNLRVPVFFEQNDIKTIGHAKYVRRKFGGQMRTRWFVRINSQRMRDKGATQKGMELLLQHEAQGHCRGYGHGEANEQVNPAFRPKVKIQAQ